MSSPAKFFRAPVASYEAAEVLLVSVFGPDPFLGPANQRPNKDDLVYWPLHSDPEDAAIAYRREAWGCAYLLGDFADNPAYAPPENIEEVTEAQYWAAFPPSEN